MRSALDASRAPCTPLRHCASLSCSLLKEVGIGIGIDVDVGIDLSAQGAKTKSCRSFYDAAASERRPSPPSAPARFTRPLTAAAAADFACQAAPATAEFACQTAGPYALHYCIRLLLKALELQIYQLITSRRCSS